VEICEIADHPWFLGCQFHPEFKSKPMEPHPLFKAFVGAALAERQRRETDLFAEAPALELRPEPGPGLRPLFAEAPAPVLGLRPEPGPGLRKEPGPRPEPAPEPSTEPQYSRAD
jgi:hypothetical protein